MRILNLLILTIFIIKISPAISQTKTKQDLNLKELQKKAEQQYKLGDWYSAIATYKQAYQKAQKKDLAPEKRFNLVSKLADLNKRIRNYPEAAHYYQILAKNRSGGFPKSRFNWALMAQQQGRYDTAIKIFQQVKERYQGPDAYALKKRAEAGLKGSRKALKEGLPKDTANLMRLDSSINSPYSEFSPVLLNDTSLLYASRKVDSLLKIKRGGKAPVRTRFYKAHFKQGKWQHKGSWQAGPNLEEANVGNGAFSSDRKRFYFTKCRFNQEKQQMGCQLYVAERQGDNWKNPRKLPSPVNVEGASTTHPTTATISRGQETKHVLIFASDRDRGRGQMDIWYSTYEPNSNDYSRPRNMGRKVNTKGDEVTPFFDSSEGKLYFSSNGRAGYGGLDVFAAKGQIGRFREDAKHLGAKVNSPADDLYYHKNDNGVGFIVSNRRGVEALKHPTCCDDLFATKLPASDTTTKLRVQKLRGIVKTVANGDTLQNESGEVQITLYLTDKEKAANRIAKQDTLSKSDSGKFTMSLKEFEGSTKFYLKASKSGYQAATSDSMMRKDLTEHSIHKKLFLSREKEKITAKREKTETKREKEDEQLKQEMGKEDKKQKDTINQVSAKQRQEKQVQKEKQPEKLETGKKEKSTSRKEEREKLNNEPVVIKNVNYGFDEVKLDEKAKSAIDTTVYELMMNRPEVKVQIRSHTDNAGSEEYNLKLSQRRAERVVNYLVEKGIDPNRLEPKGFGERRHIAPNFNLDGTDNPEGRRKNRRTEFKILNE